MAWGNKDEKKFELEHCPNGGFRCQASLKKMNDLLNIANEAIIAKDYRNALKYESEAFEETFFIVHENCIRCADLFRNTILNSVETQILDLKRITSGIFKKKSYLPILHKAEMVLNEMRQKQITYNNLKYDGFKKEV